jgi:hypothetical protein
VTVAARGPCVFITPSVSGTKRLAPLPTLEAGKPNLALGAGLHHDYVRLAARAAPLTRLCLLRFRQHGRSRMRPGTQTLRIAAAAGPVGV